MRTSLLTTKLYFPPPRASLVPRPKLIRQLQDGLHGPLILISAPAGSGKTTLLSEWRAGPGSRMPVAWVSLDSADNDLRRFFQYLLAALDMIKPGIAEKFVPLLQASGQPNVEATLTLLLNLLSELPQDFVLTLDDYHIIETSAIHEGLTFLLDHLPPRMHIILLTRSDPPLPLARLRARDQLTEIRAADLRFSGGEAACFLNQIMGLDLSSEQVSTLELRTEGWIAGLQMAALSMRGREDVTEFITSFSGSHQYIVDFLGEEVLNSQPEIVREFLLKTSILERLTAPLCEILTSRTDGQVMLERLGQSNLFLIPLDDDRRWFRYHHLFADLLRNHLQRTQQPVLVAHLHRQAAEWFENNSFLFEALDHALAGGDFERAARLLGDHFVAIASSHQLPEFVNWIQKIPEPVILAHPRFCIFKAYVKGALGDDDGVDHYIQAAVESLENLLKSGQLSDQSPEYASILAEIRGNQVGLYTVKRDFAEAFSAAKVALALVREDERFVHSHTLLNLAYAYRETGQFVEALGACGQALASAKIARHGGMVAESFTGSGRYLKIQGRLHNAWEILQEALSYGESQGFSRISIWAPVYYETADLLYQWNLIPEAMEMLQKGIEVSQQGGRLLELIAGLIQIARSQIMLKELEDAQKTLDRCALEEQRSGSQQHHDELAFYQAYLQVLQGNPSGAAAWASKHKTIIEDRLGFDQGREALARVHLLIATGKFNEALEVLPAINDVAQAQGCTAWQIEGLVLQTQAWQQTGELDKALNCLEKALSLGEPDGFMRVFLDEGKPVQQLLKALNTKLDDRSLTSYSRRILAAFSRELSTSYQEDQPLVSPLSKRELELLALVAAGFSNKEIANKLYISIGTVKRHTVNIFTKLDVKNRTEAVARARELELL